MKARITRRIATLLVVVAALVGAGSAQAASPVSFVEKPPCDCAQLDDGFLA